MSGKISHKNVVSVQKRIVILWLLGQKNWNFQQILFLVLALQKTVLSSFLLLLSVCYQHDLSDSERKETENLTACNLNNN